MTETTTMLVRFFDNFSVGRRIFLLIMIPLAILLATGVLAVLALGQNRVALSEINDRVSSVQAGHDLLDRIQGNYVSVLYEVQIGSQTWAEGLRTVDELETEVRETILPAYRTAKSNGLAQGDERLEATIGRIENLDSILAAGKRLLEKESRTELELYLQNDLGPDIRPLRGELLGEVNDDINGAENAFQNAQKTADQFLFGSAGLIATGILIAALVGYFIYRSINESIEKLLGTMREISGGNLHARVHLLGNNELAELGGSFNRLVEERIAIQSQIDREHKQLNASVFALLEAVADLGERNLTVRARVTEDATGPLADAINQLAEDTTEVLSQVRQVASSVESASQDVNRYAQSVNELAKLEQHEAEETATQLESILQRLDAIAFLAQQANRVAGNASKTSADAQDAVLRTLDNMTTIRETAQETGKRLKRLGERSQEISQIIDVINNLSERTTVLALNANMQATAAGEAGRGFSMIAEEIQRLSEGSRESTEQISILVRNIQQEANATISTMDATIEQVVSGSTQAEEAARQMQSTRDATDQLVGSVERISASSAEQVTISKALKTRAERILSATRTTGEELLSLTSLTKDMAEYGQRLMHSVNVFKLEA